MTMQNNIALWPYISIYRDECVATLNIYTTQFYDVMEQANLVVQLAAIFI